MCITFIFNNPNLDAKYRLIILNNRDEHIDRPTGELEWRNGILGGIDEQDPARGTWLGMNAQGNIGNILSITQPAATKKAEAPSRGKIPSNLLRGNLSAKEYCDELAKVGTQYNGFQFLAFERSEDKHYNMYSVTNMYVDKVETVAWPKGAVVISNSPPATPYQKVLYGKDRLDKFVENLTDDMAPEDIIDKLLDIGCDRTIVSPDPQYCLQTGCDDAFCEPFSSIFISLPPSRGVRYGTRSQSIIIVDNDDNVTYFEKRMVECPAVIDEAKWSQKTVNFKISPRSN
ncbi:unnamed protein product [Auanema sp. JU1783]|nr:unnamed protein product [Auanema sp. JU1783]